MGQISLEKTFLLAAYVEALVYGMFFCLFCATIYVHFTTLSLRRRDSHKTVMILISAIMFFIATWHLIMNCIRLLQGYVDHQRSPGGPAAYMERLRSWDYIMKDTLYVTQENLGGAAAIYRCWILWNKNWRIIVLPIALLLGNCVAGYTVCATYSSVDPTGTIFTSRLNGWIKAFLSVAVVLNIITTTLMAYRIWITHKRSISYTTSRSYLLPVLKILVESAALQFIVEAILLVLYCSGSNSQYIVLESLASIVGITFNAIAIRVRFHVMAESSSQPSSAGHHVQTFGSMPLRRIQVNISQDVTEHSDSDYNPQKISQA